MTDYQKAREAAARALQDQEEYYQKDDPIDPCFYHNLDAALSAFEAHGLVLVPKEASPVMIHAGYKNRGDSEWGSASQWTVMIEAALQERQKK